MGAGQGGPGGLTWSSALLALSIASSMSRSPSPLVRYAPRISRSVGGGAWRWASAPGRAAGRERATYLVEDAAGGSDEGAGVRVGEMWAGVGGEVGDDAVGRGRERVHVCGGAGAGLGAQRKAMLGFMRRGAGQERCRYSWAAKPRTI